MRIVFLGTAAVVPEPGRDTASFVVNETLLFDTGWQAALRLAAVGLSPQAVTHLFLTHAHQDHYLGLPGLLFARAMRPAPDQPPLRIFGPAGAVEAAVERSRAFLGEPTAIGAHEIFPLEPGATREVEGLEIATAASRHTVPGLAYRLREKASGAVAVLTGDTSWEPGLIPFARGADLLVTEASYGPHPAPSPDPYRHLGAPDAARLALEAGVRRLALVHFNASARESVREAAQRIFPDAFCPTEGEAVEIGQ